jgi:hypothetical protein
MTKKNLLPDERRIQPNPSSFMEDTRVITNQQKPSSLVEDTPAIMKKLQLKSSLFRRSQRTKDWIRERPTDRTVEGTKHSRNSNKRPDMMLSFSLFGEIPSRSQTFKLQP